jgi:hypothetical protein
MVMTGRVEAVLFLRCETAEALVDLGCLACTALGDAELFIFKERSCLPCSC